MAPRTLDYIYLRSLEKMQGGHELLHLPTNKVINRRVCTKVSNNNNIIEQARELPVQNEIPKGLKITNKVNVVLFDSVWIIGVDYNETNNNNNDIDYDTNNNSSQTNYEYNNNTYDEEMNNNDQRDNTNEKELVDKKGIEKFDKKDSQAAYKEIKQIHERVVFESVHFKDLTPIEVSRAMESLIFLTEKRDGTVKARYYTNGSIQIKYVSKEVMASPTVTTQSILITGVF